MIIERVKEENPVWGVIQGTELSMPDDMFEGGLPPLLDALREQDIVYKFAPEYVLMEALRRGELESVEVKEVFKEDLTQEELMSLSPAFGGTNLVLSAWFDDLFARFEGTATSDQTLEVKYLAIGSNYGTAPASSDTTLVKELFRFVPDSRYNNGISQFTASTLIDPGEGNPDFTTVSNATTPNTSGFSVTSATNMSEGDILNVSITASGEEWVRITNISGVAVEVYAIDTGDGLMPAAPSVGDDVHIGYGEGSLFTGNTATNTANTGTPFNRKLFTYKKTNDAGILIDVQINFLPVGS